MSDAALRAAARVVGRVDRERAYSNVLVDHAAAEVGDGGRLRALVFETLRRLRRIDLAIERASNRGLADIDPPVLDLLRVSVAEMGSGRPVEVVVDGGVEAMRRVAPAAVGFANAVLRSVASEGLPEGDDVPAWVRDVLTRAWDQDEADAFLAASDQPPLTGIRLRPGVVPPRGAEPVPGIPGAFHWRGGTLPGGIVVQDPASVAVGLAVGAAPGSTVLDVGAAPGGKSLHLADQAGDGVVSVDVHPRRVRSARARVPETHWLVGDGRRLPFDPGSFDRVLIDAPCTGLGTLRRRPEIRHRVTRRQMLALATLQRSLLDEAETMVAPGGRIVYSVCTVTPQETVEVVAGRGFRPPADLPGRIWGDGLLLAPHLTSTDGMFIAVREAPGVPA